jgi:propionyl-CoA carboxylase alpha chain
VVTFGAGDTQIVVRYLARSPNCLAVLDEEEQARDFVAKRTAEGVRLTGPDAVSRNYAVARQGSTWYVALGSRDITLVQAPRFPDRRLVASAGSLTAPMPGRVVKVLTEAGAPCLTGQTLLVLEAMKMELAVTAPFDGTVSKVLVGEGDPVEAGASLLALDPSEAP